MPNVCGLTSYQFLISYGKHSRNMARITVASPVNILSFTRPGRLFTFYIYWCRKADLALPQRCRLLNIDHLKTHANLDALTLIVHIALPSTTGAGNKHIQEQEISGAADVSCQRRRGGTGGTSGTNSSPKAIAVAPLLPELTNQECTRPMLAVYHIRDSLGPSPNLAKWSS